MKNEKKYLTTSKITYKLIFMRTVVYLLSLAIVFNLGTHVKIMCETPTCAMTSSQTCSCDMGSNVTDSQSNSCCKTKVKCQTNNFDGNSASNSVEVIKSLTVGYTQLTISHFTIKQNSQKFFVPVDLLPNLTIQHTHTPLLI
ncbi:MAG: hypothetical protein HQ510_04150 [Candidatus Marinimicrobia bacterium]|nr:hypothetical protein [Candidatus Neomarinimicrobiota bacterium]